MVILYSQAQFAPSWGESLSWFAIPEMTAARTLPTSQGSELKDRCRVGPGRNFEKTLDLWIAFQYNHTCKCLSFSSYEDSFFPTLYRVVVSIFVLYTLFPVMLGEVYFFIKNSKEENSMQLTSY